MPLFVRWGAPHLGAIALTFLVPLLLVRWSRRVDSHARTLSIAWGFGLFIEEAVRIAWVIRTQHPPWYEMLPLQLCDVALIACVAACLWRQRLAYELAYFWGLAGTLQGLLTPELRDGFPAPHFWFFFLGHGGIIGAVFVLTFGAGLRPRWASVLRAFLAALVYAAVAVAANSALGTNYGFLRAKPAASSLLDFLGPWPWYIASLAGLGIVFFVALYLPWAAADRWWRAPGDARSH